ncbi:MAG: extracellular solute-binding protein [Magnetospiraceae bacterium]
MPFLRPFLIAALALVAPLAGPAPAQEVAPTHGIAMHGAPKYPADFTHFDYVNPEAPKGGLVRMAAPGTFDSLNPFILKGNAAAGLAMTYDRLGSPSADEPYTTYGLLAESMEIPEDRSWAIFNIRPEARWHDGTPITAADVVFTFDTIQAKGDPTLQFYYREVAKVEALDTLRVKFTFANAENREIPLIVQQQEILPKHYWEGRDFEATTLEPPLGSGPYKIGDFEAGRYIILERVPDYWAANLPVNKGLYNFDRIRYDYYRDDTVVVEAFKAGEYDFRSEHISKNWVTAYDIPEVDQGLMIKEKLPHQRTEGMQGYYLNARRDLFKDRRVREALAAGLDFEFLNKTQFYDEYVRSRSYFDNSELEAKGLPEGRELEILQAYRDKLPPELFTEEYTPPSTDGSGRIRGNLRKAAGLLKAAGWVVKDGVLTHAETGKTFEFELPIQQVSTQRVALPIAKNLERLGIKMTLRVVDTAQYSKLIENYDYDMVSLNLGGTDSPGNEQWSLWSSEAAARKGAANYAGVSDPVVDDLIKGIITSRDREELVAYTRALDRVLQWGFYTIPGWHIPANRVVYWNKFDRPAITPEKGLQFSAWWINPEKEKKLAGRIRSVPRQ